jgi:uncharacterized protein
MNASDPKFLTRAAKSLSRMAESIALNKFKVLAGIFLITAFFTAGMQKFKIDQSMEAFFNDDDPTLVKMKWFKYVFGSDEFIMIMYEPKDGDVFSKASLTKVTKLEKELNAEIAKPNSSFSRITRVRSIVSADYLENRNDSLISRKFIGDNIPETKADSENLRTLAMAHPDYPKSFFSENSKFGVIMLQTDFGARIAEEEAPKTSSSAESTASEEDEFDFEDESEATTSVIKKEDIPELERMGMEDYVPVIERLDEILAAPNWKDFNTTYKIGNPIIMGFFSKKILPEISMFSGASIVIIWIVMLFAFRSAAALVWPTVTLVLSVFWTIGSIGWMGADMTFMVNIIIFLLLSVSMATSIHIMSGFGFFRSEGMDKMEAIKRTYSHSAIPVILAGFTTAIGLFALLFVPIPAINNFGGFAALGVIFTLLINLFIWPALLTVWSPKVKEHQLSEGSYLGKFLIGQRERAMNNAKLIVAVFIGCALIVGSGIPKVYIDTNFTQMINSNEISGAYDVIDEHFGGTTTAEVLIDTGKQDGAKDFDVLNAMDAFSKAIKEKYAIVTKTTSLVGATKDSHKNLTDGSEDNYSIPDTNQKVAQVLLNFESADIKTRKLLVDDNWQVARITVGLNTVGTSVYAVLFEEIQEIAAQHFNHLAPNRPGFNISYSGGIDLMTKLLNLVSTSQIKSFSLALATISVVLFLLFGSVRFGLMAMVPNIFPLVIVMGVAGWLGIPLDSDTLLVLPIAIGIAVDDTIHLLTHYREERATGSSVDDALDSALRKVGQAMTFTTVVLSCGFLVFVFSLYKPLNNFGFLSAVAISSALLADLFLLPVMIKHWAEKENTTKSSSKAAAAAIIAALLLSFTSSETAIAASFDAEDVAKQSFNRDDGNSSYQKVILISCGYSEVKGKRKCSTSKRKKVFEMLSQEQDPKGEITKSLSLLLEPASEKGVGFLQEDYEDDTKDSSQWMYLPALKKMKKIVSASTDGPKTGSFFGSELSYEDMEKRHETDYTYKGMGEESIKGRTTFIIEMTPTKKQYSKTSYGKSKVWIDKESLITVKSELFDKQDKLAKTFVARGLTKVSGIWTTKMQIVVNHKTKRMSMMKVGTVKMNPTFSKQLLSPRALTDKNYLESELRKLR